MVKYKYEGKVETLKTKASEITIQEFKDLNEKSKLYKGGYLYYLEVFNTLGLSDDFIDCMDDKALYIIIKDFQKDFSLEAGEYIPEIELDGYTYKAFDGEDFRLGARDFANIEERLVNQKDNWIEYALAIIFKRTDLSKTEHNVPAHIKHKEKLFKGVTMDVALPYINHISTSYIKNLRLLADI